MNKTIKEVLILMGLFLLVMSPLFAIVIVKDIVSSSACEEIGFDSYTQLNEIDYCVDTEKNLYTVSINCKYGFFKCEAKQIEIRSYKP